MPTETPQIYDSRVLSFIYHYSPSITTIASIATQLNGANQISPYNMERYIAGFIAEEYNDRYESPFSTAMQAFGDWYLSQYSEIELANSIAAIDANPALWDLTSPVAKLRIPGLIDVGPGNIQLYTAVTLLREYSQSNPTTDPLNIKQYGTDLSARRAD